MPNKQYQAGRRLEYECMARWKRGGYEVARSAGSHGIWDLCAVKHGQPVNLIQCKRVSTDKQAVAIIEAFRSNPPLMPDKFYHQILEVKIKGLVDILSVTV